MPGYRFINKNEIKTRDCFWYNELIRGVSNRLIPITSDGLCGQIDNINYDTFPLYFSNEGNFKNEPGEDSYQAGYVVKID